MEGCGIAYTTAIAIDKDKHSQAAMKWAVDNLLNRQHLCILIHVRTRSTSPDVAITKGGHPPTEVEMQQLFLPFRGFCARKGIEAREVVLHDIEVASTLIDYIETNAVSHIVVGASSRSSIMRKLKNPDVPTSLTKSAPEFCSVHVVAKGKLQSCRAATRYVTPNVASVPKQPSQPPTPRRASNSSDSFGKGSWSGSDKSSESSQTNFRDKLPFTRRLLSENMDHSLHRAGNSYNLDSLSVASNSTPMASWDGTNSNKIPSPEKSQQKLDDMIHSPFDLYRLNSSSSSQRLSKTSFETTTSDNLDYSYASEIFTNSGASLPPLPDLEAEMRKLKLELQKSMEKYESACKEAQAANLVVKDLSERRTEEAHYEVEEAKQAEEAALARVEMEKQRCKMAMEAAEMAEHLMELEVQRRKETEMTAKREEEERKRAMTSMETIIRYRRYTIEEIELATNNFSPSLKVGEGGYGPVYKATLDHTDVAIKVLGSDISQGQRQFQQEIEVLSCMRHPNMVLLVGACHEYGCLVYEYMENGSLEDRLFRKNNTPPLHWTTRFKIAAEISIGLLFLHQTKPDPLVHRDLKPANILLDKNYVGKISDVGLARLVPASVADSVTQYHMTAAAGTFCYIDPEYQQTGMLGTKSDVYSLGVMLLQIITALPAMGLTHKVESAIEDGTFADILDPDITDWPVQETLSFAKMALKCCELRKRDRPDLNSIIVPELNRLRDLAIDDENSFSSSSSSSIHSGDHMRASKQREIQRGFQT